MKNLSPLQTYMLGLGFWMSLYALTIVFNNYYFVKHAFGEPQAPALYLFAVLPALPVGGSIWVILRYMNKCDEYFRAILTKRFVLATGLTLFVCTAYGFLENYAGVQHFDLYYVWVLFWVAHGIVSPFVRSST